MSAMTKLQAASTGASCALVCALLVSFCWTSGAAAADAPAAGARPRAVKRGPARMAAKPAAQKPASEPAPDASASDLDSQLLQGTPSAKPSATKPPGGAPPAGKLQAPQQPAPESTPQAAPEADHSPSNEANPLARIAEQMQMVQHRLESLKVSDADTTELQEQIVAELAELIKQLERQQSSQQSASKSKQKSLSSASERKSVRQPSANPNGGRADDRRPAKESSERTDKGERTPPTPDELRGLMKDVWGQLPAREREQMLQSPPEQFLPKYELLLEKYYKRLAEEQKHRP